MMRVPMQDHLLLFTKIFMYVSKFLKLVNQANTQLSKLNSFIHAGFTWLVFIFFQCIHNGISFIRVSYLIFHLLEETGQTCLTDFFVYMSITYGFIHSSFIKTVFVIQLRSNLSYPWLYYCRKINSTHCFLKGCFENYTYKN